MHFFLAINFCFTSIFEQVLCIEVIYHIIWRKTYCLILLWSCRLSKTKTIHLKVNWILWSTVVLSLLFSTNDLRWKHTALLCHVSLEAMIINIAHCQIVLRVTYIIIREKCQPIMPQIRQNHPGENNIEFLS